MSLDLRCLAAPPRHLPHLLARAVLFGGRKQNLLEVDANLALLQEMISATKSMETVIRSGSFLRSVG